MILTIPTIYLINGKSKYSISGLPEFSQLDTFFKENPIELAKLFREENNKSILFHCDNNLKSINLIQKVSNCLDIPIQVIVSSNLNSEYIDIINNMGLSRIFTSIKYVDLIQSAVPIIKLSEIGSIQNHKFRRFMIDFEESILCDLPPKDNVKFSVINSNCDTEILLKMNQINTSIDSIYLGKDYYGIHFAGQLLWRIAEKQQFSI